jgi:hypothetical protein
MKAHHASGKGRARLRIARHDRGEKSAMPAYSQSRTHY